MNSFIKKAFSLTELLIVLVIVAVLFAALAPIMTKRSSWNSSGDEPVWFLVNNDEQRDAFFDPGQKKLTSTAFFGLEPSSLGRGNMKPYSKAVIKANKNQNMFQFRYGAESEGSMVGLLTFDNQGNLLHVNKLQGNSGNNYNNVINNSKYNTAAGAGAFTKLDKAGGTVAIGANAVAGGKNNNPANLTAIGANAGQYAGGNDEYGDLSVFVGMGAGRGTGNEDGKRINSTVALGTGVLGIDSSSGSNNVFAGHNVSTAGILSEGAQKNTIINQPLYYGTYPVENTIVGYYSYTGGDTSAKAITAVGYNACSSMSEYVGIGTDNKRGGSRTCLGYGSGMSLGTSTYHVPNTFVTDKYDHIILGGTPNGFGGQGVLEVHNINTTPALDAQPKVGPTVVLNSNLVVRGGVYFPKTDDGNVQSVLYDSLIPKSGKVQNQDYCSRGCCIGSRKHCRKWRGKNGCKPFADFFNFLFNALIIGGAIWGAISAISGGKIWSPGSWISNTFSPSQGGRYRAPDPPSGSAWVFSGSTSLSCSSSGKCPSLKTSDRRLKADIYTNKDALDKIMYVMPYNYTYKADKDNTPQVGVIAQDLEKYSPNSVSKDDKGYLSIRWDELFYITINSVKALDEKLTNLNSTVQDVEKDTVTLKGEQKATKNRIKEISKRIDKLEK